MPEGHTVHRLATTFDQLFHGQRLAVSSPQGRFAAGAARLDGRVLVASEAWGKQMFLGFAQDAGTADGDDVRWLRVHLGLYGAWTFAGDPGSDVVHAIGAPRRRVGESEVTSDASDASDGTWQPPAPRGQVRVRMTTERASADLTGPTACEVVTAAEKAAVQARLGPDPLRDDADPEAFVAALTRSRSSVALLLMNQEVLAGVGNIYRAESLYRARLDPRTPGTAVPRETALELWADLVDLMHDGVRVGAIVTTRVEDRGEVPGGSLPDVPSVRARRRTRQNTDGLPGAVPHDEAFYVYHRDGLPCRICGTTIALAELGGRTLYWCPRCQAS
ncbi:zinc finger domain-containing protein [Sanguibacter sp. 25GB23B1]|uniref:Fpg/Nei family DNA glycosylase n=1 Tax=unclassified Sanguibacter TaxID=2645534 RepID=UPI0032AF5BC3